MSHLDEVLELLVAGVTPSAIARVRGIKVASVYTYIAALRRQQRIESNGPPAHKRPVLRLDFAESYHAGRTTKQIAEEHRLSAATVRHHLRRLRTLGLLEAPPKAPPAPPRPRRLHRTDRILELLTAGHRPVEIARLLDVEPCLVNQTISRLRRDGRAPPSTRECATCGARGHFSSHCTVRRPSRARQSPRLAPSSRRRPARH